MKKRIAYILAIMMLLSCTACGKDKTPTTNSSAQSSMNSSTTQNESVVGDASSEFVDSTDQNSIVDNSSQIFDNSASQDGYVSGSTFPDNTGSQSQVSDPYYDGSSTDQNNNSSQNDNSSTDFNSENQSSNQENSVNDSTPAQSSDNASTEDTNNSSTEQNSENASSNEGNNAPTSSEQNGGDNGSGATESTVGNIMVTDTPIYESYITIDDSADYPDSFVEYKTAPSTIDTAWDNDVAVKKGNSDEEAKVIRDKVLNTKNTLDYYDVEGTVYYVSPNGDDKNDGKTPETAFKSTRASIFTMNVLKPGDAVLFERGGLWRLTSTIRCKEGITYGSYGKGEKPTFYGSAYNYANKDYWHPSNRENIWKITVADSDVGLVVFDHGEIVGIKKLNGIIALENNGDYYFNKNQDMLYVYYDGGNPGKAFEDIEIGLNKSIFTVTNANNVTVDNLRMKYVGRFGLDMCGCDNSVITNCEIGFIGGAIQSGTTRLGNGIQVWNGVTNHRVENCWIYQIYDAGVTFQGNDTYQASHMGDEYYNVTYKDNLFEYCTYSIEFWHGASTSEAVIENYLVTGNVSRFAGYGWGRQRKDHTGNHLCVFERAFPKAKNNKITDNIFDLADSFIVKWGFKSGADNGEWDISNNTYYHGPNKFNQAVWFGSMTNATNLSEFKARLSAFETSPKKVVWVDEVS